MLEGYKFWLANGRVFLELRRREDVVETDERNGEDKPVEEEVVEEKSPGVVEGKKSRCSRVIGSMTRMPAQGKPNPEARGKNPTV